MRHNSMTIKYEKQDKCTFFFSIQNNKIYIQIKASGSSINKE